MSPVEVERRCHVREPIERETGEDGRVGDSIAKLPAEFVLELLESSRGEPQTNGGGEVGEGYDCVVGAEKATKVELEEVGERHDVPEGHHARDFVVVVLDVAVRLVRHIERSGELARILAGGLACCSYGVCVSGSHVGDGTPSQRRCASMIV